MFLFSGCESNCHVLIVLDPDVDLDYNHIHTQVDPVTLTFSCFVGALLDR
jgi:hypothetical protein